MDIEWDENKRKQTVQERGLDFADVALIDWDSAITLDDLRYSYPEPRYITFANINERLCVVAWCYRAANLRVISMRKANTREVRKYE